MEAALIASVGTFMGKKEYDDQRRAARLPLASGLRGCNGSSGNEGNIHQVRGLDIYQQQRIRLSEDGVFLRRHPASRLQASVEGQIERRLGSHTVSVDYEDTIDAFVQEYLEDDDLSLTAAIGHARIDNMIKSDLEYSGTLRLWTKEDKKLDCQYDCWELWFPGVPNNRLIITTTMGHRLGLDREKDYRMSIRFERRPGWVGFQRIVEDNAAATHRGVALFFKILTVSGGGPVTAESTMYGNKVRFARDCLSRAQEALDRAHPSIYPCTYRRSYLCIGRSI